MKQNETTLLQICLEIVHKLLFTAMLIDFVEIKQKKEKDFVILRAK